ncbi:uncharacterized protein LOC124435268 [Xenia sp. Carnegie-2017]|uniref:uncharacterized protein LOC124435268 n=1 Tax=Xenia sp. Carnegie-2017 TaxID=2897299 RepID=UPI001F04A0BA|nr:uncharacterized protein LOC124435268 [Xenia sp. Carnegie-2017]
MTYRTFETEEFETPGPSHYGSDCSKHCNSTPEYSCRRRCRPSFPAILNYPEYGLMKNKRVGPDSYDAEKGFHNNSSPAFSIGKRHSCLKNENPGPSHYTINSPCKPDAPTAPTFTMGIVTNKVTNRSDPGPAAYYPKTNTPAKGCSMGSRQKPQKVNKTPAPNAYNVIKGQTSKGINNGCSVSFKSRASPYVYSGFTNLSRITT